MQDLKGKVAVVTGGASGIGEAMAEAFAEVGMHVVIADIEGPKADAVAKRLSGAGVRCVGARVDVTDLDSVKQLADRCYDEFGAVHLLCNNAGVLLMGPGSDMIASDWRWTFDVNVMGIAHGLEVFLPRMRAQNEPCHVVNTSSVSGLVGKSDTFIYSATKAAATALSEALREELEGSPIGVSVVLPSNIRSNIVGSQRNRPKEAGREYEQSVAPEVGAKHGLDPRAVGIRVREGVLRDEFYIFTLPASGVPIQRGIIESRSQQLLAGLEAGVLPGEV
jgi:NAD(P)-dependent dehydrogenase (short-subunit alcohol dehydrogenase family)